MRKTLAILIFLFVFSQATAFQAELNPVKKQAEHDNPAKYKVTVYNNDSQNRTLRFSSITSPPSTSSWFNYPSYVEIPPKSEKTFLINVKPPENAIQGNYGFTVNLRLGGELEKRNSFLIVSSESNLHIEGYNLSTRSLKPGKQLQASLTIISTKGYPIKSYNVSYSFLGSTQTVQKGIILPGMQKTISRTLKVPEKTDPGKYSFKINITTENGLQARLRETVTVQKVKNISYSYSEDNKVLLIKGQVKARNNGNYPVTASLNKTFPSFLTPITGFEPKPDAKSSQRGSTTYIWKQKLSVGETAKASYTINFIPALILLLLIITGLMIVVKIYKPVKISKQAVKTEGGVKIRLEIKNRSSKKLNQLEVVDRVPNVFKVNQNFEMARPVTIKTSEGTQLRWEIDEMTPGEQRVLEYKLETQVKVDEGVELKPAELKKNSETIKKSESAKIYFE